MNCEKHEETRDFTWLKSVHFIFISFHFLPTTFGTVTPRQRKISTSQNVVPQTPSIGSALRVNENCGCLDPSLTYGVISSRGQTESGIITYSYVHSRENHCAKVASGASSGLIWKLHAYATPRISSFPILQIHLFLLPIWTHLIQHTIQNEHEKVPVLFDSISY